MNKLFKSIREEMYIFVLAMILFLTAVLMKSFEMMVTFSHLFRHDYIVFNTVESMKNLTTQPYTNEQTIELMNIIYNNYIRPLEYVTYISLLFSVILMSIGICNIIRRYR